jgi:hypothetical protein
MAARDATALQPANACLLIVDLAQPDCVDQVMAVLQLLAEKGVALTDRWGDGSSRRHH